MTSFYMNFSTRLKWAKLKNNTVVFRAKLGQKIFNKNQIDNAMFRCNCAP